MLVQQAKILGDAGLHDFPRAPRNPRATSADIAELIVKAKKADPLRGPKKIIPTLRSAHPDLPWPALSTAGAILDQAGLVKHRKRSRRSPPFADPFADVACFPRGDERATLVYGGCVDPGQHWSSSMC